MKGDIKPLSCRVQDCTMMGTIAFRHRRRGRPSDGPSRRTLCHGHQGRKRFLGSYTARQCSMCRKVVDDVNQGTHFLERLHEHCTWKCEECLMDTAIKVQRLARPSGMARHA